MKAAFNQGHVPGKAAMGGHCLCTKENLVRKTSIYNGIPENLKHQVFPISVFSVTRK